MTVLSAGTTYAEFVSGLNFTSGGSNCSLPSSNLTQGDPFVAAPGPTSIYCLNAVDSGIVNSAWESNLTNYTSYRNGSATITGCPPISDDPGCPFFASNRYTEFAPDWEDGTPTNTSTSLRPNQPGYLPSDAVFYVALSFNRSTVPGTLFSLTVDLQGATPSPVHLFVRTSSRSWSGNSVNLTILFDMTAAWYSVGFHPPRDRIVRPPRRPGVWPMPGDL